jgi:predicted phosphate transport protein (TIGR00153 family)
MVRLFQKTKLLETQVDDFLNIVSESGLLFKEAIRLYLADRYDDFEERRNSVNNLERRGDDLRREIETQLYTNTLIPESRGDVLGLLESLDNITNTAKQSLLEFSIEKPAILPELKEDYAELAGCGVQAVEALVLATRAFFRDIQGVKDHLHKVIFYEKEADRIAERLRRKIFSADIDLSRKNHLRYITHHIGYLPDRAEDVADRLAISTIKRSM